MKRLVLLLTLVACGKGDDKKPEPAVGSAGSGSAAMPGSAATGSAAGSGSAAAATPVALSPKIKAARCGEPCLFLVDTPLDKMLDTYKTECGGMETKDLGFTDCKKLDYMRNCIYAAHGMVYKRNRWKGLTSKPWYDAHADFKADAISALERSNVHELHQRGKACKKGITISGADYERIKKWFAALPKTPAEMPAVILVENEAKKPAELIKWLMDEIDVNKKHKIVLGKQVTGSYVDPSELSGDYPSTIKAPKDAKLRAVALEFETSSNSTEEAQVTEGAAVRFIYDDKDKLIAITGQHYLYD
jgi:YARHG domain